MNHVKHKCHVANLVGVINGVSNKRNIAHLDISSFKEANIFRHGIGNRDGPTFLLGRQTNKPNKSQLTKQLVMTQIEALADIKSVKGKIVKLQDGSVSASLIIEAGDQQINMPLPTFHAIYNGFVKCWPVVKPLKDEMIQLQRTAQDAKRDEDKVKAEAAKQAERARKLKEREAAKAVKQVEKDARKVEREKVAKERADRAAKDKAAKDAKVAADKAAKEKAAKEAKAKKDKAAKDKAAKEKAATVTKPNGK